MSQSRTNNIALTFSILSIVQSEMQQLLSRMIVSVNPYLAITFINLNKFNYKLADYIESFGTTIDVCVLSIEFDLLKC